MICRHSIYKIVVDKRLGMSLILKKFGILLLCAVEACGMAKVLDILKL